MASNLIAMAFLKQTFGTPFWVTIVQALPSFRHLLPVFLAGYGVQSSGA